MPKPEKPRPGPRRKDPHPHRRCRRPQGRRPGRDRLARTATSAPSSRPAAATTPRSRSAPTSFRAATAMTSPSRLPRASPSSRVRNSGRDGRLGVLRPPERTNYRPAAFRPSQAAPEPSAPASPGARPPSPHPLRHPLRNGRPVILPAPDGDLADAQLLGQRELRPVQHITGFRQFRTVHVRSHNGFSAIPVSPSTTLTVVAPRGHHRLPGAASAHAATCTALLPSAKPSLAMARATSTSALLRCSSASARLLAMQADQRCSCKVNLLMRRALSVVGLTLQCSSHHDLVAARRRVADTLRPSGSRRPPTKADVTRADRQTLASTSVRRFGPCSGHHAASSSTLRQSAASRAVSSAQSRSPTCRNISDASHTCRRPGRSRRPARQSPPSSPVRTPPCGSRS